MNIGLMCACVPSVTLLIDRIKKKGSQADSRQRNLQPRSHFGHNLFDLRRKKKSASSPYATETIMHMTFNTELAVLSEQRESPSKGSPGGCVQIDGQGRCVRIDSAEGRREGWLAPAPPV